MRLFTKYFLFGMLVFGLALSLSGYFLLHYSMESSMAREADFALKQYQYDKFTVQSALLSYRDVSAIMDMEAGSIPNAVQFFAVWQAEPEEQESVEPDSGAAGLETWEDAEDGAGEESREEAGDGAGGEIWKEADDTAGQASWKDAVVTAEKNSGEGTDGTTGEENRNGPDGTEGQESGEGTAERDVFLKSLFGALASEISVPVAFFLEDGSCAYSEIAGLDPAFLEDLSESAHVYQFRKTPGGGSVLVGSVLNYDSLITTNSMWSVSKDDQEDLILNQDLAYWIQGGEGLADVAEESRQIRFVTQWDITKTIQQQETMRQYFIRCYLGAMAAGMVLMGILSALLTRPLKRMSKAARRMAEGYYEERLAISGRDEIGELAGSFNQMAGAVEDKIGQLSRAAREKEDFVANFAHELKTPLTSIIGYADTIYQKDLPREEVRRASWHIWNEGMRLESLSFKLMELTVLGRQEFPLEEMPGDELLQDVAEGLAPLLEEKQVEFCLEAQPGYIRVDYDLLKTLLINLVDNSVKAGSSRITLQGQAGDGNYRISVRDNGCGMEEEALSRITEAFYMVDKARSRKQHGAGLGLALADRIARIHGGRLQFRSSKGVGTEVSFCLQCEEDETVEKSENHRNSRESNAGAQERAERQAQRGEEKWEKA